MSLCQVQWSSKILGKQVGMNVILPDDGGGPFPVFYLLHGLSDDYTAWLRRTRVETYAGRYPLIVAMPDGFRGFYTDNEQGPRYARYVAEEVTGFVERTFPARGDRAGRCVGGLSMGGYGALRLALGHPERFASATSHSGAVMHGSKDDSQAYAASRGDAFQPGEMARLFGLRPAGTGHDLLALAARARDQGTLPKLRLDCGLSDFLLEDNRQFRAALERLDVPCEYEEFPGEHNWDYWELHVQDALDFHAEALGYVSRRERVERQARRGATIRSF